MWLEFVPLSYIDDITITTTAASASDATVSVTASLAGSTLASRTDCVIEATLLDGNSTVAKGSGVAGSPVTVAIRTPRLWSPASPFLYNATVALVCDGVEVRGSAAARQRRA